MDGRLPVAGWASLRARYRRGKLPDSVIEAAEAMGITWNIHRPRATRPETVSGD